MAQIILKERTAHLASYTFLQEILINIKTRHCHSYVNHQQQLFHRTLITGFFRPVNIAKFLRTAFLQNTSRRSHLQIFLKIGTLKSFANFIGKYLCWSVFLKNLQAKGLQLHKKTPTQVFFCEVCEIFRNTFSCRTPPVAASALKVLFNSYFAALLGRTNIFFFSTHRLRLMYKKLSLFVYKFVVDFQVF